MRFAARAAWALGDEAQALDRVSRAMAVARELSHAESLILARNMAGMLHALRVDAARAQEEAESAIALADEYGMEMWGAFGNDPARLGGGHARRDRRRPSRSCAAACPRSMRPASRSGGRSSSVCWPTRWPARAAPAKARPPPRRPPAQARATGAHAWLAELDRISGRTCLRGQGVAACAC